MSRDSRTRRVGTSTYDIVADGVVVGTVWRTRYGWSGRTVAGCLVVEDYPGSMATAVNLITQTERTAP